MSQESNTTSDTNPKPRLQIARPKDAPPASDPASPAPAPEAAAAMPRFSFARKKAVEAAPLPSPPPAPVPSPASPLRSTGAGDLQFKRPPEVSRQNVAQEPAPTTGAMPAPLTPVTRAATPAPFPGKTKFRSASRSHVPLLIILGVLVVIVGGESAYILMQDEQAAAVIKATPPVVIGSGAAANKPVEISANGPASSPAAKFLQIMPIDFVDAGASPKLSIGGQLYQPGQVIDKATGLRWILIDDKARQMEFVDGQGLHYIKKF
jgi:hypothetical protein